MVKKRRYTERSQFSASKGLHLLLLCGFFLLGAVVGHVLPQIFGSDYQLQEVLFGLADQDVIAVRPSIWRVSVEYLRFPVLALFLGYCSFVLAAIPILMAVQGFFLSFAASTLSVALGTSGTPVALASFGLRSLITIGCTLVVALWSFRRATGHSADDKHMMKLFGICFLLLVLGIILELTLLPTVFSLALEWLK